MITLNKKMSFITYCDSPALWQTYLSDPASITMEGILIFNKHLLFLLTVTMFVFTIKGKLVTKILQLWELFENYLILQWLYFCYLKLEKKIILSIFLRVVSVVLMSFCIDLYQTHRSVAFCAEQMPAVIDFLTEEIIVDPIISTNMAELLRPDFCAQPDNNYPDGEWLLDMIEDFPLSEILRGVVDPKSTAMVVDYKDNLYEFDTRTCSLEFSEDQNGGTLLLTGKLKGSAVNSSLAMSTMEGGSEWEGLKKIGLNFSPES